MEQLPDILQYLFSGLATGSIYAIVAVGFTIIFSSTQVVNFAQGEFVMLGAMGTYMLTAWNWHNADYAGLHLPLWLAIAGAVLLAALIGMLLGCLLIRPLETSPFLLLLITFAGGWFCYQNLVLLRNPDPLTPAMPLPAFIGLAVVTFALLGVAIYLLIGVILGKIRSGKEASVPSQIIVTVGASMLFQGIASQLWGKDAVSVDGLASGALLWQLPNTPYPVAMEYQKFWVMGLTLAMVLLLTLFFNGTIIGKAMRAVSVNRHGARLMGINVPRMVIGAFALSAALGALAGAAIAPISCGYYNMGTMMGLKGFAAAIVGGLGNFTGSVIAGLLLGVMESLAAGYISSDYKDAFAFIVLLVVLIISPHGLPALIKRYRKAAAQ